jgi:transcriptional regulator with XRE-family HTH domain
MSGRTITDSADLANKITRLVEERGWNQEEFARITRLNRHTVRQILLNGERRLRNATISACARALGLSVNDLRTLTLEQLLPRMRSADASGNGSDSRKRLREEATNADLLAWAEDHSERVRRLAAEEIDELLAIQHAGGSLTAAAIDNFVARLERRRKLVQRVTALAGSEYLDLLEVFVNLLFEKIRFHSEEP